MAGAATELAEVIRSRIRESGPIGFDTFMRMALYDPRGGYYAAGDRAIGRAGDFYTSVSVGDVFGRLVAEQHAEVWRRMGSPERFTVVEQGAGDGQLADDVLEAVRARHGDGLGAAMEYVVVEPIAALREAQEKKLGEKPGAPVRWVSGLEEIRDIEGVYFSNECLDAFPCGRIRFEAGAWREMRVALEGDSAFRWETGPVVSGGELAAESALLAGEFPEGYTTEIRPAISDWARSLAGTIARGLAIVVDYGFTESEFFDPGRSEGTLRCFREHRATDDPLVEAGVQDMTAHVNFTRVAREAVERGFALGGYADQHHYLVGVGQDLLLEKEGEADARFARQFQTLTHPGMMGRVFKVLALVRGLDLEAPLAGFRHGESVGI